MEQAIAILRLLHTEDVTTEILQQPTSLDQQSIAAAEHLKSRRPNLNFEEMEIPIGASLQSTHDDTTVTVVSAKKVMMSDEPVSLSRATRQVLGLDYNIAPSPHWTFEGRLLKEIYEETYGEPE